MLRYCSFFDICPEEKWTPPPTGVWKINCDAAFKNGVAALDVMVIDDCGTLIEAVSKSYYCKSAFEVELKTVEWATTLDASKGWRKLIFATDAHEVVNNISLIPKQQGWILKEETTNIRAALHQNNWSLIWNNISSNRLADELAKLAFALKSNLFFSSLDLSCLQETFCSIYASEIVVGSSTLL